MQKNKKRASLLTMLSVIALAAGVYAATCHKINSPPGTIVYNVNNCPGSCSVSAYSAGMLCQTTSEPYAHCEMTDFEGHGCTDSSGTVSTYAGQCAIIGGNVTCINWSGSTPTVLPGTATVPCSYGYDAELCPS